MKKILTVVLCTASMALTACGGSYCDDAVSVQETLSEKACPNSQLTTQTKAQCETAFEALNESQQKELEDRLDGTKDCVDDLDECTEATATAWALAAAACSAGGTNTED